MRKWEDAASGKLCAFNSSFDDLIRPQQDRGWDGEAKRLRGLQVDDEIELGRPLDR